MFLEHRSRNCGKYINGLTWQFFWKGEVGNFMKAGMAAAARHKQVLKYQYRNTKQWLPWLVRTKTCATNDQLVIAVLCFLMFLSPSLTFYNLLTFSVFPELMFIMLLEDCLDRSEGKLIRWGDQVGGIYSTFILTFIPSENAEPWIG